MSLCRAIRSAAAWLLFTSGCASTAQPDPVNVPAPPVATTVALPRTPARPDEPANDPLSYANAGFRLTAAVRETKQPELGQSLWELDLNVSRPKGADVSLDLTQRVRTGCETASVVVEGVPALGDPRLVMINLRCDIGEDYLSRSVVTALVLLAEPPAIVWEGSGTYSNQMGQCESINVPVFDRGPNGSIRTMQWFEVVHHPPANPSTPAVACRAVARQNQGIQEIPIPR